MNVLNDADFERAAAALACPPKRIRAICTVEAPRGGFDADGRLRMLFEGHQFSKFTNHIYDKTHPTISARTWAEAKRFYSTGANPDIRNAKEHKRFEEAMSSAPEAAFKSASWGKFQMMGFNHAVAGYNTAADMVGAFENGEGPQLDAFINFVKKDRGGAMLRAIQRGDAAAFAELYNGEGYKADEYDTKLEAEGF